MLRIILKSGSSPILVYPAGEVLAAALQCNAIRAMVNSKDDPYAEALRKACADRDECVLEMAVWNCRQNSLPREQS
ncbi:MAG: hypothetical protein JW832_10245 [Deltaproteobacteria bacterium]|nr:hypothetical protein [Deltaproteobacteria bacterium]